MFGGFSYFEQQIVIPMFKFKKWLQLLLMAGFIPSLLVASVSESRQHPVQKNRNAVPPPFDADYAVFSSKNQWPNYSFPAGAKDCQLTKADFIVIDSLFRVAARKEPDEKRILGMKRQCIAMILPNGERQVFLNCMVLEQNIEPGYWKKQFWVVDDGGRYYMACYVSLTHRTITPFQFHGVA